MTAKPAEKERIPAHELAQLQDALHRLQLMQAAHDSFYQALDRAFNWPTIKPVKTNQAEKLDRHGQPTKYNRAPQKWKGRHGYEFVCGVMKIRARDNCNIAAAIRKLKESDQQKWPEGERDLQRRYQEAKDWWGPWCEIETKLQADEAALLAETEGLVTKS
jgi:lysyl-tRNA synthetase class I